VGGNRSSSDTEGHRLIPGTRLHDQPLQALEALIEHFGEVVTR
jgi:hypothetical protein